MHNREVGLDLALHLIKSDDLLVLAQHVIDSAANGFYIEERLYFLKEGTAFFR